jgi:type IV secretion system protein VirD4
MPPAKQSRFTEYIRPINPCLFILDEFGNVGRIDKITLAADAIRKFSVRLWPFIQSIPQIRDNYGNRYESLI